MLDAYTQAQFGDPFAQPVTPNVQAALMALRADPVNPGNGQVTSQSYPFYYEPEVAVNLRAHIQGVARLGLPGYENWFVVSKHHHKRKQLGGILLLRWSALTSTGNLVRLEAPAKGPGVGRVQSSVFGRAAHPGGMQLCGRILAVAQTDAGAPAAIDFCNLSDPVHPTILQRLVLAPPLIQQNPLAVTSVALTRNRTGNYLCFAYHYSSSNAGQQQGWLFESNMNVLNANTGWILRAHLDATSLPQAWREDYESIGFIGQSDGTLYLAGMRGFQTSNQVDLFRCTDNPVAFSYVATKHVSTRSAGATFRAGASLYLTRPGYLALYTSQMFGAGYGKLMLEEFSG